MKGNFIFLNKHLCEDLHLCMCERNGTRILWEVDRDPEAGNLIVNGVLEPKLQSSTRAIFILSHSSNSHCMFIPLSFSTSTSRADTEM